MMFSAFIAIFFRLFNFALLIIFVRYVYKKYLHELLLQGAEDEHQTLKSLEREVHEAQQRRTAFDAQFHDDQELIIVLKKKIALWAAKEYEQRRAREDYKEVFRQALHEKANLKQVRITEYMIERDALPLIIAEARKQLEEHYRSEKESSRYIEGIVNTLNTESSAHEYR